MKCESSKLFMDMFGSFGFRVFVTTKTCEVRIVVSFLGGVIENCQKERCENTCCCEVRSGHKFNVRFCFWGFDLAKN